MNTNNIRLSSSTSSSEEQLLASENISDMPPLELDDKGIERVKLQKNGWETYKYQDKFDCNYISAGEGEHGTDRRFSPRIWCALLPLEMPDPAFSEERLSSVRVVHARVRMVLKSERRAVLYGILGRTSV